MPPLLRVLTIGALLPLAGCVAVNMPGRSFEERLPEPSSIEIELRERLQSHVAVLADTIGERNLRHPEELDAAATAYIRRELEAAGYAVEAQSYDSPGFTIGRSGATVPGKTVENLEASLPGRAAETAELPPYLWGRIAASLERESSPRQTGFRSWVMPVFDNPLLARAAAAVLAVAILAAGGAIYIERKSSAAFKRQALAEMQLAQNSLVALDAESYNPFRTAEAAYREVNPFSRDQVRPDINPFRSAAGNR